MDDAIRSMLNRYDCQTRDDHAGNLREILQVGWESGPPKTLLAWSSCIGDSSC